MQARLGAGGTVAAALGLALAGGGLAFQLRRRRGRQLASLLAGAQRSQRELAQRETQLAQALALANMGYFILDLDTRRSSWSPEFCRLVGEDPATARPSVEGWWRHVHPEDRPRLERKGMDAMSGSPSQNEFRMIRADGKTRWVYGRVEALRDGAGAPRQLIGTVQDITEQKEVQAHLAAAERLATVGTLAAGVAHEINNPLASVISNMEFALEELLQHAAPAPGRADALVDALGEALQGAERVCAIVRDLMAYARPGEEVGPVEVERVLDLAINMASPETRYRARVVKDYGRVPLASGDAARLGQVFLNVLVNAAQSIPAGHPEDHEIRVVTRRDGDHVSVSVRHTGEGMTAEVLRRVFEPFFSTKPVGTGRGLGLYASLAAIRAMGGDIVAQSEPGRGSTFTVTVPVLPGARSAPGGPRRRVLIIDDEPLVVAEVSRELAAEHEVHYAPDGAAGLDAVAAQGPFDAILCDLEMPGMNGATVHEALRRRDPEAATRMVFLTDGSVTRESRVFLAATRHRLVTKPVSADDVRKLLRPIP